MAFTKLCQKYSVASMCKSLQFNMTVGHLLKSFCARECKTCNRVKPHNFQNVRSLSYLIGNITPIQRRNCKVSAYQGPTLNTKLSFSTQGPYNDSKIEDNKKSDTPSDVRSSLRERFQEFRDEDADEILDIEEMRRLQQEKYYSNEQPYSIYEGKKEKTDRLEGLVLERGVEGVFDIEELVEHLRQENLQDICVIAVPPELRYADYLVLVTALSRRHGKAVTEFIRKLHKRKKDEKDKFVIPEGENSPDWQVFDTGNIVLHIFLQETREKYDIETLWTVGPEFDPKCRKQDDLLKAVEKFSFVGNTMPVLVRPEKKRKKY